MIIITQKNLEKRLSELVDSRRIEIIQTTALPKSDIK